MQRARGAAAVPFRKFNRFLSSAPPFSQDKTHKAIRSALDARSLDAFTPLSTLAAHGFPVHYDLLSEFYAIVEQADSPLATHMFAELVPYTGMRNRRANLQRVIRLYLRHNDVESALAFVRDIQMANSGQIVLAYDVLESLLLSAKYHRDGELAWRVVQLIAQSHPHVYARTWGLVVSTSLDTGHFESLQWIWREACIPGYVVLDDHSYLRMAELAAHHGSLAMAQWAALRMRRRQRALNIYSDRKTPLRLFACLIEAAATASLQSSTDRSTSEGTTTIRAACRYLVRLSSAASEIEARQLPLLVNALVTSTPNREFVHSIWTEMKEDSSGNANSAVCTLLLNILLATYERMGDSNEALQLAGGARATGVVFNEETILTLIRIGGERGDSVLVNEAAARMPTRRVLRLAARTIEDTSSTTQSRPF